MFKLYGPDLFHVTSDSRSTILFLLVPPQIVDVDSSGVHKTRQRVKIAYGSI